MQQRSQAASRCRPADPTQAPSKGAVAQHAGAAKVAGAGAVSQQISPGASQLQASGAVAPQFGDRVDFESDLEESRVEQLHLLAGHLGSLWCAGLKCASGRLWTGSVCARQAVNWTPEARERLSSSEEASHARSIRDLLERFVGSTLGDVKRHSFMLAAGRLTEPPFSAEAMMRLRRKHFIIQRDSLSSFTCLASSCRDWGILTGHSYSRGGVLCYRHGLEPR